MFSLTALTFSFIMLSYTVLTIASTVIKINNSNNNKSMRIIMTK